MYPVYSSSDSSSSSSAVVCAIPAERVSELAISHTVKLQREKRTVKITLASLGYPPATLVLIELDDTDLLEGLDDLAVDAAGGVNVLRGPRAPVLGRAVEPLEAADADGLAEVDVAGDGRGADVEPVDVLGRKLLGGAGLDQLNPSWGRVSRFAKKTQRGSRRGARDYNHVPGMGSLPWRFKKAA